MKALSPDTTPLRILRIITRMNTGGPSRQVALLSEPGAIDGITQVVYGACPPYEREDPETLKKISHNSIYLPQLGRSLNPFKDLFALLRLIKIIQNFSPHIVHTHTAKAGFLGRIAAWYCGVPVIVHTFHGNALKHYFSQPLTSVFRKLERILAKITDVIIVLSPQQYQEITEEYQIGNPQKNIIVPLGLNLQAFQNAAQQPDTTWYQMRSLNPSDLHITWCGRLTPVKNPLLIIDIALRLRRESQLPKWKILVAGDGELRPQLEAEIQKHQLDSCIQLLSWEDDLVSLWKASAIALLSSWNEGTPVSLIEAMASSVPIVATRAGGVQDIVPHQTCGLLSETGNAEMLSSNLSELLLDENLRTRMGSNGKKESEKYDIQILIKKITLLYRTHYTQKKSNEQK